MKWIIVLVLSGIAIFGIMKAKDLNWHTAGIDPVPADHSFAILELFTSEGCSSCPPADRLLPQLANSDTSVIPLSFHVDYWNRLGWTDPFSKPEFSERQKEYGNHFRLESIYTPQLIINGEYEMVGSNRGVAEADIKKVLAESSGVKIFINKVEIENGKLSVRVRTEGELQNSDLIAALVQEHAETNVKAGENRGATLTHTNVVREFARQAAKEDTNLEIPVPADLAAGQDWQLVIYMQRGTDLRIIGACLYKPKHS